MSAKSESALRGRRPGWPRTYDDGLMLPMWGGRWRGCWFEHRAVVKCNPVDRLLASLMSQGHQLGGSVVRGTRLWWVRRCSSSPAKAPMAGMGIELPIPHPAFAQQIDAEAFCGICRLAAGGRAGVAPSGAPGLDRGCSARCLAVMVVSLAELSVEAGRASGCGDTQGEAACRCRRARLLRDAARVVTLRSEVAGFDRPAWRHGVYRVRCRPGAGLALRRSVSIANGPSVVVSGAGAGGA